MQLFAYNPIGQSHELLIWVGVLGIAAPPAVVFEIFGQVIMPVAQPIDFEPLGDEVCDALGQPLNHRAIFALPWPATSERFTVTVIVGDQRVQLTSKRLPQVLPGKDADSFNLLLSSCYYQPNDKAQSLASITRVIKPAPDFTLLAGDQVYLDLPSQQNLPSDKKRLAQSLGKKYQLNWFSTPLKQPGLANVLSHGPVLCVPDDHEFWNNFPCFQVQLNNTHREKDRANWCELALRLYERYQTSPAQDAGFFRQDIAPLAMLFLDGRTRRDADGKAMFSAQTCVAITDWKNDLLTRKKNRQSAVGLLSSGQALLIEKPGIWDRHITDMEMINYQDFSLLDDALAELFDAEIPVLYITGDVHWGRIVEGTNLRGNILFYEVISSPSRLLHTMCCDEMNSAKDKIRTLFGAAEPFPMHPTAPDDLAEVKLANLGLQTKHTQQGDHVALLRFHAIPGGLEFSVDYVCTDVNEKKRREYSSTHGPFKLLSF